jgi:hypothetical protein
MMIFGECFCPVQRTLSSSTWLAYSTNRKLDKGLHLCYTFDMTLWYGLYYRLEFMVMALLHNFSTQLSDPEKLKQIAAKAGFTQTRGPQKGQGSIRQLLEALIQEQALIAQRPQNARVAAEQQDLALQQKLLNNGLISAIKPLHKGNLSPFSPVDVEGEPISQMIVRERR